MFHKLSNERILQRLKPVKGKIKIVIDTDAFNEVDDQFAIAWALRSPERLQVQAIYAAPFSHKIFSQLSVPQSLKAVLNGMAANACTPQKGMELSYNEILNLCKMLSVKTENFVYRGSAQFLTDKVTPIFSEAAGDLVERAMASEETLYVMAIGALTNIASAILMEPKITEKIVVVWLGGQPVECGHGTEFNMMEDIFATQIVFDCAVPLVMIPCMSVASHLSVSREELEAHLKGKSEIGAYLTDIVLKNFGSNEVFNFINTFYRNTYLKNFDDYHDDDIAGFVSKELCWSRIIWDISAAAYLLDPRWVLTKTVPAPILRNDLSYEAANEDRHPMRIATYAFRDPIYGDLFKKLSM